MAKPSTRPITLIVRDGWGANPHPEWNQANAVHLAGTPVDDRLMTDYPHVQIRTSGPAVGLPDGVTGNSEVGHQNIGAGRIVDQELLRIAHTIREGSFYENEVLRGAFARAVQTGGLVHIMGLCSSAGVHSTLEHCYALLELAKHLEFPGDRVLVHCFGDGRDTPPNSGAEFVAELEAKMRELRIGRVASVIGRFYAMDRDHRWERVRAAYELLTRGTGYKVSSAQQAFRRYYDNPTDPERRGDEFIEATAVVDDRGNPLGTVRDGDSVIFFNFRGDRPRELIKAFVYDEFPFVGADKTGTEREMGFHRPAKLDLYYCTMTEYEEGLPVHVAFAKPPRMVNIFGAYLSELGLRQFRTAETEKFPHVTFFFNDYRDEPYAGEDRSLAPSPRDVHTYDRKPEMSARPVTIELLKRIEADEYDFILVNYANPDMVGHTGNLPAAIKAVETVDECVGRVVDAVLKRGGGLIVTADHGNCEQMIDPESGGPHTAHTTYDVELIVVDDRYKGRSLRARGRLADIAPTLLQMMNLNQPPEMTGRSLIDE